MSHSHKKEKDVIKLQEEKGVRDQISNLAQSQTKEPITFSGALKSRAPADVPLSKDPRLSGGELNKPKSDLGGKQMTSKIGKFEDKNVKKFERPTFQTSESNERNLELNKNKNLEGANLGLSNLAGSSFDTTRQVQTGKVVEGNKPLESREGLGSNLEGRQNLENKNLEGNKMLGEKMLGEERNLEKKSDTTFVPPQTAEEIEGERLASSFTQVPSIDEEKIKEYLVGALAYLKEAEEKMAEKFAEARQAIIDMHPKEKLTHAYEVTKDTLSHAAETAVYDAGFAKEGIVYTYDKVKDLVLNVAGKVSDYSQHSYAVLKEKLGDIKEKIPEEYEYVKGKASEMTHKAQEMYENTKHMVQESEVAHMANALYHKVQESELAHKASEVLETTKHKVEEVSENFMEKTKGYLWSAGDEMHEVAEKFKEGLAVGEREARTNERMTEGMTEGLSKERIEQLRKERLDREFREAFEADREKERLSKIDDENTRIRLMNEEAPK